MNYPDVCESSYNKVVMEESGEGRGFYGKEKKGKGINIGREKIQRGEKRRGE